MSLFKIGVSAKGSSRNVELTPSLRVLGGTTTGKFRLNGKGSELLFIAPTEHIAFFDDKSAIQQAIAENNPAIMEWAEENGLEPQQYPVTYLIGRGIPQFDKDGEPLMVKERGSETLTQAYYGHKTATASPSLVVGNALNFSEGSKWGELFKAENAKTEHTAYDVNPEPVKFTVSNGYEDVDVTAYVIENPKTESLSKIKE